MDVNVINQNTSFVYDPAVVGYETSFIKAISGTPTVSSSKLRLNAAEIATYDFFKFADVLFVMTVPAAPTSGDVRAWGLKVPALGNNARVEFDITGAVFSCKVYDDFGTAIGSTTVVWDATWTAAVVRYRIRFTQDGIKFYVDLNSLTTLTCVARFAISGNASQPVTLPTIPQVVHIINSNADNLDVTAIVGQHVHSNFKTISATGAGGSTAVTSIVPGTAATNLGKAEDAAHTSGDVGVMMLGVRNDGALVLAGTTGDYIPLTTDAFGNTNVNQGTLISGENQTANVLHMRYNGSFTNMTTATTTTVKAAAGHLHSITVGLAVATGTIAIYDNTAGSGTLIGTVTFGATVLGDEGKTMIFDCNFATGLTLVTSQATNLTIVYS